MTERHGDEGAFLDTCVRAYDIGPIERWQRHGGTAGKTWRVWTSQGDWFLRLRGVRTSSPELVAFDHGLREHLVSAGVPTAVPLPARSGATAIHAADSMVELYPFVDGRTLARAGVGELRQASRMLARFHRAAADYPRRDALPPVSQYSTVGLPDTSARMEDPELLKRVYHRLSREQGAGTYRENIELSLRWLDKLCTAFGREAYDALPHTVTHGDFTLANLLFDPGGSVCGVFDFDWSRWAPRIRDVADGMFFLGGERRTPLVPADIWSLTEDATLHRHRCVCWLRSYSDVSELTAAEVNAVPLALAARWLSVRVEGMAKVPPDDRRRFCFGNLAPPLRWLDENWDAVCCDVLQ